jgi:hypothetical protein
MLVEPLPPRIAALLDDLGIDAEQVTVARKSALKLNETLPTIWIVGTVDQIVLCCTHRTRGLWRRLARAEVNTARAESRVGHASLRLFLNSDQHDVVIPLPKRVTLGEAMEMAAALPATSREP